MKIGIIGASGKAGSIIALEAKQRRHEVTAIVRDKTKVDGKGYAVLEKDLFDLTVEDLKGFDAVVDAFGTAFDPASAQAHQTSLKYLTDIMEKLPEVRLLVVGGAASLYTDRTRKQLVLDTIPAEWQAVPGNMKAAFEELQKSRAKWTYFSPAATFDPKGPRTGKYKLGSNILLHNSDQESYLSYADYAVAMLDEIEDGTHIRERITAVSEKTPNKDGYYGIENKKPVFEGISTYRPHLNHELTGRCFRMIMDRTGDQMVTFQTDTVLEYTCGGRTSREPYQCAKGAELAYFVNFEIKGAVPRDNVTLIIDLQTNLVTVVNTYTGYNDRYHTMCDSDYDFGAIDLPDRELPKKRHGYTTDLVGKRIQWHYGPEFAIIHCYYHPNYVRATFDPSMIDRLPPAPPEDEEAWKKNPYDEKAVYVKIRDGLYVVSFVEQSMSRRGKVGNSLLFLMDTDRLHDVGRSFGHSGQFGGQGYLPENYLFGAYGEFVPAGDGLENDPPYYTV
jgi:putative NADH-flavin reductase